MVEPVSPVDQVILPEQPEAVNWVLAPWQMVGVWAANEGAEGIGFTVTAIDPAADTQPFSEQVAV